jgi:hypothetical protein
MERLDDYLTRVCTSEDNVEAFLQGEVMEDFEEFLCNRRANHSTVNETSIILTVPSAQRLANFDCAKMLHQLLNIDVNEGTIWELKNIFIPTVNSVMAALDKVDESIKDTKTASEIAAAYAKLHKWGLHSTKELVQKPETLLTLLKWMLARVESHDMTRKRCRHDDDDDDDDEEEEEEKEERSYHPLQTRAASKSSKNSGRTRHSRMVAGAETVQP